MLHLLLFMAFTYYKSVTIDHTQVGASDLTDYPVTIWVTDADLKTVANGGKVQNGSGFDIRPFSNSGLSSALTFQLVAETYVATTGAVEMHVKIPTVSHTADTVFYLAFGDSGISTDGSSTATWNSGFNDVWHFNTYTAGVHVDLTSSVSTADVLIFDTFDSSDHPESGQIDGADGLLSSLSFLRCASINNFTASPFTLSMWVNTALTTQIGGQGPVIFYKGQFQTNGYYLAIDATGAPAFVTNQSGAFQISTGTASVSASTWTYVSVIRNGASAKTLVNGIDVTTVSGSHVDPDSSSDPFQIGSYNSGFITMDGIVDEVRVSNTNRTVDWELATYNNQKTGSTFLTYGALTPVGGSNDNFDWLQRRAVPLPNWRPTWITVP